MTLSRHQRLRATRKAEGLCTRCGSVPFGPDGTCGCRRRKHPQLESAPSIVQGCRYEDEVNAAGDLIAKRCVFCGKVVAIVPCLGCGQPLVRDSRAKHYHGAQCHQKAYRKRMKALRDAAKAREVSA